ncbi:MAG: hypothetical protein HY741_19130 [Chloroflexi bacterium]|nr:hypothetical protein [Chloroflexota bacterium]
MLNVKLDAQLVETLKRTTAEQGVTVDQVIDGLARKYIAEARRKIIDREFEHYQTMHAALKEKYLGENVAIHQGQLIDHDSDARALVRRVQKRFGHTPILFIQVEAEPIPELVIRSPRLVNLT